RRQVPAAPPPARTEDRAIGPFRDPADGRTRSPRRQRRMADDRLLQYRLPPPPRPPACVHARTRARRESPDPHRTLLRPANDSRRGPDRYDPPPRGERRGGGRGRPFRAGPAGSPVRAAFGRGRVRPGDGRIRADPAPALTSEL